MSTNDPVAESIERLSRSTLRVSKALSPDDSTLADAVAASGGAIAAALHVPYAGPQQGGGQTLAEVIGMAFGGTNHNDLNVPGGLSSIGAEVSRGLEAVAAGLDSPDSGLVTGLYAIAKSINRLADVVEKVTR
jgi:hypothetical protein